ncbi:hypothetical protein [Streptomyces sp. ICBB 8177]|uniref:hypothetical protein n=1 Tax=Streptomyces sp. ICBB 8177 TaxID=563922 RepID=UPI0018EE60FC|nr:hypothetical protein [Streptomyces sp. ICBB 8177]
MSSEQPAKGLAHGKPGHRQARAREEARAHATLGRTQETRLALESAEQALARLDQSEHGASAFAYSESQLRFHSGNAWTHLGHTGRAREEHDRALELYPVEDFTDRSLIVLDQAMCLAMDGDVPAAAVHATETIVNLPAEHRSALIIYRAREFAARVPEARRAVRPDGGSLSGSAVRVAALDAHDHACRPHDEDTDAVARPFCWPASGPSLPDQAGVMRSATELMLA